MKIAKEKGKKGNSIHTISKKEKGKEERREGLAADPGRRGEEDRSPAWAANWQREEGKKGRRD